MPRGRSAAEMRALRKRFKLGEFAPGRGRRAHLRKNPKARKTYRKRRRKAPSLPQVVRAFTY